MKSAFAVSHSSLVAAVLVVAAAGEARADVTVEINKVSPDGIGAPIGTLTLSDTPRGLSVKTDLSRLPPGQHGFHVHEHGSCEPAVKDGKQTAAAAAGSHMAYPGQDKHAGPEGTGHVGDLPLLTADQSGRSDQTLLAPRLKLDAVKGRALMIHEGGDNYADTPEPLGGGRGRIACGVVK